MARHQKQQLQRHVTSTSTSTSTMPTYHYHVTSTSISSTTSPAVAASRSSSSTRSYDRGHRGYSENSTQSRHSSNQFNGGARWNVSQLHNGVCNY